MKEKEEGSGKKEKKAKITRNKRKAGETRKEKNKGEDSDRLHVTRPGRRKKKGSDQRSEDGKEIRRSVLRSDLVLLLQIHEQEKAKMDGRERIEKGMCLPSLFANLIWF